MIAWPVIRTIWWWAPEIGPHPGLVTRLDLAGRPHHLAAPAGRCRPHRGRPGRHPPGPPPHRRSPLVPGHPAPHPDLLRRVHHHQPHRQPAVHPVGPPTPVGERVWIWLRPGLALDDLQTRPTRSPSPAGPTSPSPKRPRESNSAFVRLDIKRRDALTGTITSPLLGTDHPRHPRPGAATPVPSPPRWTCPTSRRRRQATPRPSQPSPGRQEHPAPTGPGCRRSRHHRLDLNPAIPGAISVSRYLP